MSRMLTIFNSQSKKIPLNVELANNFLSRALGLMFRTKLEDNKGMLFVFDKEDYYSLWMLFTFIPLEAIFISADKKIIDIVQLQSHDLTAKASSVPAKYILEVPAGFSSKNDVKKGNTVYFD